MKFLICLLFLGCSNTPTHIRGIAMTIPYDICIEDRVNASDMEQLVHDVFKEIDESCNHWNPKSALSEGRDHHHIAKLKQLSGWLYDMSSGLFDARMGPLISEWKNALSQGKWLQNPTIIDGAADYDGIAKGYAVDLISERLQKAGCNTFLVQWGGECYGAGREWKMLIPHPESTRLADGIDVVTIKNQAIATSGDYIQQWNVNGRLYTHLVSPKTLEPLEVKNDMICSVTAVCDSCAVADGLATAGMLLSPLEFKNWSEKMEGVAFWAVTR